MEENIAAGEVSAGAAQSAENAETMRAELNELRAWKSRHEAADSLRGKREAIARRLRAAGALAEAVPLMVLSVGAEDQRDAAQAAEDIQRDYPGFFGKAQTVPTGQIPGTQTGPEVDGSALHAMSAEDINRHWEEVKAALRTL